MSTQEPDIKSTDVTLLARKLELMELELSGGI
jgi:hypothetical protein